MAILANQKLHIAHALAKDTNGRAKEVEAKAHATEEKGASVASWAIQDYKNFENFKSKVGEAIYDAYLKGFTECNEKVFEAFSGLDLQSIIIEIEEQEEEEEVKGKTEAKIDNETLIIKAEEAKTIIAVDIEATKDVEQPKEVEFSEVAKMDKISAAMEVIEKAWIEEATEGNASIWETIEQVMVEMEAIINTVVEAMKSGSVLSLTLGN